VYNGTNQIPQGAEIKAAIKKIQNRYLPQGGFSLYGRESIRPDATAWAVLALEACGSARNLSISACRYLAKVQRPDGRLTVIEGQKGSFWPTFLSILAWKKIPGFESELDLALKFLLKTTGKHMPKQIDSPFAHDTSIKGWPWIENTHSWIEPTSLAVLALRVCGYGKHERIQEAVHMILDRQLPSGGWNYGNSLLFGKQLMPIPECTGHALCALADIIEPEVVKSSINYLNREVSGIRTPLALSWSIFGLTAWSNQPLKTLDWILESLALQSKYGSYDTALLSQLLVAYFTSGDLLSFFSE
jgi:hypothetical protein